MKRNIYDILESAYCWLASAATLVMAIIHG